MVEQRPTIQGSLIGLRCSKLFGMNSILEKNTGMVVYTAIFGNVKDELRIPAKQTNSEIKFYAFLDREQAEKLPSNYHGWHIRPPYFNLPDPRLQARKHKVLSHALFPNSRFSLWLDGSFQLTLQSVDELILRYLADRDLCVFRHKSRNCIYDELQACIDQNKDNHDVMRKQVARYREQGYPPNHGLVETSAVLRRHNTPIVEFNQTWWDEISTGSCRDQLSFNYVMWKMKSRYSTFEGRINRNPYFSFFDH
jgi:hypothetical protein